MFTTYLEYLKGSLIIAIVVIIVAFTIHYEHIRNQANEEKEAHAEIVATTAKLLQNNKIDQDYEKQINIIDTAADNSKIEDAHAKISCNIPAEWLRSLSRASR